MRFAPEVHITLFDEEQATSSLWLHGRPTETVIDGSVLNAALAWREYYVLMLCSGNPFEDVIHIHFLSDDGRLLDTAFACIPYLSGEFEAFQITGPNRFSFEFFANDSLQVTLYPKPRFRIPFLGALGVIRPLKLWRYFSIRRLRTQRHRAPRHEQQ